MSDTPSTFSLLPYPFCRDSGVPWLGEVPAHWEVQRIKRVCRLVYGDSLPQETRQSGGVAVYGSNGRVGEHTKANTLAPCLIIGRKGSFGKVNYSPGPVFAIDTTFYIDQRTTDADLRWLYYLLSWIRLDSVSKDSAVPGLDREEAYQKLLPVPPLPEQLAIVRYLDYVDRRIRRYIRAKQKLIALLNEQKQAIIHQAVMGKLEVRREKGEDDASTFSLIPSTFKMKPSGVAWLGDVPEHWEIRRNGRLFVERNETGFSALPILEVSLRTGIQVRDFDNSSRKQVMSDRDMYKRAVKGDIAYNMMRMWQGALGVAPCDGLVSPAYVVARPLTGTGSQYYSHLFRTAMYMSEVDKYSRGIVKDRNRLYWEGFKQMPSPYPPPDEQIEIVVAIENNTSELGTAMARIQREIALLREYRTRLIADVVTGKLDVRAAAAALPEEVDEPELLDEGEVLGEEVEEGDLGAVDGDADA